MAIRGDSAESFSYCACERLRQALRLGIARIVGGLEDIPHVLELPQILQPRLVCVSFPGQQVGDLPHSASKHQLKTCRDAAATENMPVCHLPCNEQVQDLPHAQLEG